MKQNKTLILLFISLCLLAFFIRDIFLSASIKFILGENISFKKSWELPHQTLPFILFVFSLGIIPFLYLIVKSSCRLETLNRRTICLVFIISTGLIFLIGRVLYLKREVDYIKHLLRTAEFTKGAELPSLALEEFHLELFLVIGLGIGTLIAMFFCRKRIKVLLSA